MYRYVALVYSKQLIGRCTFSTQDFFFFFKSFNLKFEQAVRHANEQFTFLMLSAEAFYMVETSLQRLYHCYGVAEKSYVTVFTEGW